MDLVVQRVLLTLLQAHQKQTTLLLIVEIHLISFILVEIILLTVETQVV